MRPCNLADFRQAIIIHNGFGNFSAKLNRVAVRERNCRNFYYASWKVLESDFTKMRLALKL